jgi:hypothetical protein
MSTSFSVVDHFILIFKQFFGFKPELLRTSAAYLLWLCQPFVKRSHSFLSILENNDHQSLYIAILSIKIAMHYLFICLFISTKPSTLLFLTIHATAGTHFVQSETMRTVGCTVTNYTSFMNLGHVQVIAYKEGGLSCFILYNVHVPHITRESFNT